MIDDGDQTSLFPTERRPARDQGYQTMPSGKRVSLRDPRPTDLDPRDMASVLARLPRWGGTLQCEYSVAHHSLIVAETVEQWCFERDRVGVQCSHEERVTWILKALTHEFDEFVLGADVPAQVKAMFPDFAAHCDHLLDAGFAWLGLGPGLPLIVHRADMAVRAAEARDLRPGKPFHGDPTVRAIDRAIVPLDARSAEVAWLRKFNYLTGGHYEPLALLDAGDA